MSIFLPQDLAVPVGRTAATAIAWRFKGELRVTAIVKATFAFASDSVMARTDPQAILRDEVHHGGSPARSIRFTTDLVPYRKRADVLFTGSAHAPAGRPVESRTVRLAVFEGARPLLDKKLLVRKKGGFQTIPLTYERAFGGIGFPENPFGEGFLEDNAPDGPNIVDPADPRRVAGFAPIAEALVTRKRLLGSLPRPSFGREIVPIPDAFDWDFFQASPADQRTDFLRGEEWIVLEGLHPTLDSARMRLPGARGLARIHGLSGFGLQEGKALAMYADTLHISGDEQRCTVTWRGTFPVASEAALAAVRIAAGVELPGEPIAWPDPAALARSRAPGAAASPAPASTDTLPLSSGDFEILSEHGTAPQDEPLVSTLVLSDRLPEPFAMDRPTELLPEAPREARETSTEQSIARGVSDQTLPVPSRPEARRPDPLPFHPAPAGAPGVASPPAAPKERPAARGTAGDTLPVASRGADAPPMTLPFRPLTAEAPPAEEPAAPAAPPTNAAPREAPPAARAEAPEPAAPAAPPRGSPWAPAPPAPPPPQKQPPQKPPPKVDVRGKLYGPGKKGR